MADIINQSRPSTHAQGHERKPNGARQQAGITANGDSAVCRCLMSKAKILNLQFDPTVPPSNDRSYWCVHTQTVIGPDGAVAEPEACQSGRSCYDHDS